MDSVVSLQRSEIKQAAKLLQIAFKKFPLMVWLFLDDVEIYNAHSLPFFEFYVTYAVQYGLAFRSLDFEACLLCKKPSDLGYSWYRALRSGVLNKLWKADKRILKRFHALMQANKKLRLCLAGDQFWYAWFLGVNPAFQGKDYYKQLMIHLFSISHKDTLPCYLETVAYSDAEKVHAHLGFESIGATVAIQGSHLSMVGMLRS